MIEGFDATRERDFSDSRRRAVVFALPFRARLLSWRFVTLFALPAAALFVVLLGTGFSYRPASLALAGGPKPKSTDAVGLKREAAKLKSERRALEASLRQRVPKSHYVIIDQTHNRLLLKKDDQTVLDAKCSAGSGMVLQEDGGKNRKWIFDTPRGRYRVQTRVADPIWKKPDWAFVEEGLPIPRNPEERFERGTLGEYALYLGDGYMIHGTLYERLLGRSVTHGCIRLGREDLRVVWANAPLGTPVYIY